MQTLYRINSPPRYLPGMFSEDLIFIQITSNCEYEVKHSQACQHQLCIKLCKINEWVDLKVWLQFNLNEWIINMRSSGNAILFSSYVSLHLSLQQGSRKRNLSKSGKSFKCSVVYYSQSQKTRHPEAERLQPNGWIIHSHLLLGLLIWHQIQQSDLVIWHFPQVGFH